jgi:hypothetical protein
MEFCARYPLDQAAMFFSKETLLQFRGSQGIPAAPVGLIIVRNAWELRWLPAVCAKSPRNTQGINQDHGPTDAAVLKCPVVALGELEHEQDQLLQRQSGMRNHPVIDLQGMTEPLAVVNTRETDSCVRHPLLGNQTQEVTQSGHRHEFTAKAGIVEEFRQLFRGRPSITSGIGARSILAIVPYDLADALTAKSSPHPYGIRASGESEKCQREVVPAQVSQVAVIR